MKYSVIVENIKVPIRHDDGDIIAEAERRLKRAGLYGAAGELHIRKKSIDARHRENIVFVCSVSGRLELAREPDRALSGIKLIPHTEEKLLHGRTPMRGRPVIAGFGPAGMFCALELGLHGYAPLVFERGGDIDERIRLADRFMSGGNFTPDTNIQFGAGGAGTFSDGKLTTRIGDPLCELVLERLCSLGAPQDILWKAKPHIGTDILRNIVRNADREIKNLGGEIQYNTKISGISSGSVIAGDSAIRYGALVLAIGHSARDTYAELIRGGFDIAPKPFSVGVRIEHLRRDIDRAMFGDAAELLPPAEYALSYRSGERGVYTFCMCPGGYVVPAASEDGGVVTNGMSLYARDGENSNSAVAVSVLPEDFGNTPDGAIGYQRELEAAAYRLGGGDFSAPAQTVGSFLDGGANHPGKVRPTYRDGCVRYTDLGTILPPYVTAMLRMGLRKFGQSIDGFDAADAILTGVETRTSAPIRILRGEDRCAPLFDYIYPCGEGAGYAGGIMSAAVDGIRTARAIIARFAPPENLE